MVSVFERVKKVILDQLGADEEEVLPTANLVDDLGASYEDLEDLVSALEKEFSSHDLKVKISEEDAERFVTVQDIVDYLKDTGVDDR